MAWTPDIIVTENLTVDSTDMTEQVMSLKFTGQAETVTIPATFGQRSSVRKGNDSYSVEVTFLQDYGTDALTSLIWEELADSDGEMVFAGSFESGSISASNPLYTATAIVTEGELGGAVNEVGQTTVTFPLKDRPTKSTS